MSHETTLQLRRLYVQRGKWFGTDQDGARPGARIQSRTKQRGQGGRPTATHHHGYRQRTPQAAHGHCRAYAAPAMTWLPLNVVIVNNDRGDSPSLYRARALRAGAQEVSRDSCHKREGAYLAGGHVVCPAGMRVRTIESPFSHDQGWWVMHDHLECNFHVTLFEVC